MSRTLKRPHCWSSIVGGFGVNLVLYNIMQGKSSTWRAYAQLHRLFCPILHRIFRLHAKKMLLEHLDKNTIIFTTNNTAKNQENS